MLTREALSCRDGLTFGRRPGTIEHVFDSSQALLSTDLVLLREVASRVARTIGPDTPGEAAAEALDWLVGITRQLELATVKSIGRVDESKIYTQDGSRSVVAYVRRAANESHGWASARVNLSRVLADLPATVEAWHGDRIGLTQATFSSGGVRMDFGRETRMISRALKMFLVARDGGCVFPGCDGLPAWCQVHHLLPWGQLGRTDRVNLVLLCHFHHLMHEGGWTTVGTADNLLFHSANAAPPREAERHSIRRKAEHLLRC